VRWRAGRSGLAWVTRAEMGIAHRAWETMANRPAAPGNAPKWPTQDHVLKAHTIPVGGDQEGATGFRYARRYSKRSRARCPGLGAPHESWPGRSEIRMGPGLWGPEAEQPGRIVEEGSRSSLGILDGGIRQSGES
jgi:hypothetical protein